MINNDSESWSQVAHLYEEKFLNLDIYDRSYDIFCNAVKDNSPEILEIGCGPGNITKYILNKIPDADIFGIDYSEKMIQLAKKNVPTARFEVMDCRELGKIDEKFDAVISGFCLPYLDENESSLFFDNVRKLLNNDGIFYFSFVEGDPENSGYQTSSSGQCIFFNFHLLDDIKQKLEKTGFKNVQVMKINYERNLNETEIHTIIITKQ